MRKKRAAAICMAALMALTAVGCGSSNNESTSTGTPKDEGAEAIQIATKPMTEQYILGEMLRLVIEDSTDYTAEITKGIGGGTNNIQPAMEKGEFDLYPEYTSSGWAMVLKHDVSEAVDKKVMFEQLNREYNEKYDMSWKALYGFNNTYAVVVRNDTAKDKNLKTTSDLAEVSKDLVFGGNPDYIEREDGFNMLCDTYDLKFKDVRDIDIGLKYQALENGDIDVTNGFTTDAQLGSGKVTVLEDDKHLQVDYYCSTVVRNEALENYPGLEDALMKMEGILSDAEMAELNYQVEIEGKDEAEVAEQYLTGKGVLGGQKDAE